MMKMRTMIWLPGREHMLMRDPGNLCKRMNLAFFAQLITRHSTMHNIVDVFVPSLLHQLLLEFRKVSYAICMLSWISPGQQVRLILSQAGWLLLPNTRRLL
uniref:Uncharacterized protein n=1 Tax=Opuntia streptacantha TaxID=393608 RepID=A0A7C9E939_OPUST